MHTMAECVETKIIILVNGDIFVLGQCIDKFNDSETEVRNI